VASPIVASIFALTGQGAKTPELSYANLGAFYDVTSGSNGSCGGTYLCTGKPGYDGPTGNGTPNGAAVAAVGSSCTADSVCDDRNPCTVDTCVGGVCSHVAAANGTACYDGNPCHPTGSCQSGVCVGAPMYCASPTTCQAGTCVVPCSTFTGTVTRQARQKTHAITPNPTAGITLQGTLSCLTSTDIDLYLQVLVGTRWTQVASSFGYTCAESITYPVPASQSGSQFRWLVQWYSGGSSGYTLQSCTQ
jgi:hypothetical protein